MVSRMFNRISCLRTPEGNKLGESYHLSSRLPMNLSNDGKPMDFKSLLYVFNLGRPVKELNPTGGSIHWNWLGTHLAAKHWTPVEFQTSMKPQLWSFISYKL